MHNKFPKDEEKYSRKTSMKNNNGSRGLQSVKTKLNLSTLRPATL
jgi:hypothetical protein